jgi:putative FmdB family regulatory protein
VPTYTYTCTACNDVIEKRRSFSDPPLTTCEQCGGSLRKIIHPVGIVFKGSGWYINDSRSTTSSANGPGTSGTTETSGKPSTDSSTSASSTSATSSSDSAPSTSSTSTTTTSGSSKD